MTLKSGPRKPDAAIGLLDHQHAHRPVEPGIAIGLEKLDAERRVAETDDGRFADRQAGFGAKRLLIDGIEETHPLGRDGGFQAGQRFVEAVAAVDAHDAVGTGRPRRRRRRDRGGSNRSARQGEGQQEGANEHGQSPMQPNGGGMLSDISPRR